MPSTSLARVDGTSVEYLYEVSGAMKSFIKEESEAALESAVRRLNDKPGLLNRLLPSAYQREAQQTAAVQLRQVAANKHAMLALYSEVQLEIARQEGDALIASVGMDTQTKLTKFAMAKIAELATTIHASQAEFESHYGPRKSQIETYKDDHPELYERAMQSLKEQFDTYFDTTDELFRGFKAALANRLPKGTENRRM